MFIDTSMPYTQGRRASASGGQYSGRSSRLYNHRMSDYHPQPEYQDAENYRNQGRGRIPPVNYIIGWPPSGLPRAPSALRDPDINIIDADIPYTSDPHWTGGYWRRQVTRS